MLLTAPEGAMCSVEVLDDVAEESGDGSTILVQTKSALTSNPVSDRATPLWKTLAIWCRQIAANSIDPTVTTFEIYVSRPVSGQVIDSFSAAKDEISAQTAIATAREELYGKDSDALPTDLKKYTDLVFKTEKLAILVEKLSLVCGSGNPQTEVEQIIRGHPVTQSLVKDIADHMCGWVKRRVDDLLATEAPAVIARSEFLTAYTSFCHRLDRQLILIAASQSMPRAALEGEVNSEPNYIRQLRLVKLDFDQLLSAVNDYLRASIDRTIWARTGEVDEASFDELDETLLRTWRNERDRHEILAKNVEPPDRGRLLYFECMRFQTLVQGMQAPSHFLPGCFQSLADDAAIGWHPDYLDLLSESKGDSS
ncbi:MAG: ABC-three component system protein [Fimbriimonadales bacterium]